MSALRNWRHFLAQLTPSILPSRDKAFIGFVVDYMRKDATSRPLNETLRILDVGGSLGLQAHMLSEILKRDGCNPLCAVLDLDAKALMTGKSLHSEVGYVRGDAHNLPFRSDVFDAVYSFSTLDHLPKPTSAIAEQARVSRKAIITEIPSLNYFIEPHSKVPFLFYLPKKIRSKVLRTLFAGRASELHLDPSLYVNFDVVGKNVIGWFKNTGSELVMISKVYHVKWARIFLVPQALLMIFEKVRYQRH